MTGTYPDRRLEDFLHEPMETLDVELKGWIDPTNDIDKAKIAKAILAHANSGGGFIVIGCDQIESKYELLEDNANYLGKYDHDAINHITKRYCDPQIHVECRVVAAKDKKNPVLIVPGNHTVPIRCASDAPDNSIRVNKYYIRKPGPKSEEIMSGEEWAKLLRSCTKANKTELLDDFRLLLDAQRPSELKKSDPSGDHKKWIESSKTRMEELIKQKHGNLDKGPYKRGGWYAAYSIEPRLKGLTIKDLNEGMSACSGRETGWPIGLIPGRHQYRPIKHGEALEMSLLDDSDPDTADFWRASTEGRFILFRGHQEDSEGEWGNKSPGTGLSFTLPVWRTGEFLLHLMRFQNRFENEPEKRGAYVTFVWYGLKNRKLTSDLSKYGPLWDRSAHEDRVISEVFVEDISKIDELLPELVRQVTRPLYETFDFFEIPPATVQGELNDLRRRTPR